MAKICNNFVAAGAKVIFNFALDSVIRKIKETTLESVCLKNVTETLICCHSCLNDSCPGGFYTL